MLDVVGMLIGDQVGELKLCLVTRLIDWLTQQWRLIVRLLQRNVARCVS